MKYSIYILFFSLLPPSFGETTVNWQPDNNLEAFKMADINGDGTNEVIYGTKAGYIHVLSRCSGGYEEKWTSVPHKGAVVSIQVSDIDEDGEVDIIAATDKGYIHIYGTKPLAPKYDNLREPIGSIKGLLVADTDGDGRRELVIYNSLNIYIFEGRSFYREWLSEKGVGADRVVLGNVDRLPGLELVTNTGYVIDMKFYNVKWHYKPGFGTDIHLIDLDADGMEELIGTTNGNQITVYDLDTKSIRDR